MESLSFYRLFVLLRHLIHINIQVNHTSNKFEKRLAEVEASLRTASFDNRGDTR